jgi:predicted secreted protein with PEFG-CTERM motif
MVMNQERYSLVIETTTTSNGNIILKLPRDSFDAQNDDTDTAFIILISKQNNADADFIQVEYEEIAVSSDYRTIRIPLEEGDKWIEVIGTYVIPEFGTIVTMILLIAVTTTIIMSKSKFSVKYN